MLQQFKIVEGKIVQKIKLIKILEKVLENSQTNKIAELVAKYHKSQKAHRKPLENIFVFSDLYKRENETKLNMKKKIFDAKIHFFRGEPQIYSSSDLWKTHVV